MPTHTTHNYILDIWYKYMMKLGRSESTEDVEGRIVETGDSECICTKEARNISCIEHGG